MLEQVYSELKKEFQILSQFGPTSYKISILSNIILKWAIYVLNFFFNLNSFHARLDSH